MPVPFARASVPVASVPMKLRCTTLPLEASAIPVVLPEMTLVAPGEEPPIRRLGALVNVSIPTSLGRIVLPSAPRPM